MPFQKAYGKGKKVKIAGDNNAAGTIKNGGGNPPLTSKQTLGKGKAGLENKRHGKANMKNVQAKGAAGNTNAKERKITRDMVLKRIQERMATA